MSRFSDAVDHNLDGIKFISVGANRECLECFPDGPPSEDDTASFDEAMEGGFSWNSCDSCGSILGGDRYPAHGIGDNGRLVHLNICQDCVAYLANGEEPENFDEY